MKLKKIASLALAGIMAVSMLAGCGEGISNSGSSSSENTNTTSGYSAMLGEAVSDEVKNMDYVTFKDNAEDAAALRKALNNVGEGSINTIASWGNLSSSDSWSNADCVTMRQVFAKELGLKDDDLEINDMAFGSSVDNNLNMNRGLKEGVIFGIDGTVDLSEAMDQIANQLNPYFVDLAEDDNTNDDHVSFDYDYVISVSVVNKPVTTISWSSASTNFIAVTVTRTVTAD